MRGLSDCPFALANGFDGVNDRQLSNPSSRFCLVSLFNLELRIHRRYQASRHSHMP